MFGFTRQPPIAEAELRTARVFITKAQVDSVFTCARCQDDYIWGLYRLVVPGFDTAQRIDDYPSANADTIGYIRRGAEAFDRLHEPWRAPGLGWSNYCWETDSRLADWEVSLAGVAVVKGPAPGAERYAEERSR